MAQPSALWRLLSYASPHRRAIALAALSSILNRILDLAPPVLIGAAVDVVVSKQDSFLGRYAGGDVVDQLWLLAAVTLVIWAAESVFQYSYSVQWRRLAQRIQHELRLDAYAKMQNLELRYFDDRSTGGLMAILGDDINQLERFLDDGANELIQLATTIVVIGTLFIVTVPSVAWMAILPMPIVIAGSLWFQRKLEPRYAAVRARNGDLSSRLANNISGIATIKSFTAEAMEAAAIESVSRDYEAANGRAIVLSAAFVPLIRMAIVIGFAGILIYGGKLVLAGGLNVGLYSVLVFMTQRLLWPLTRLGNMLDLYQRAMASTNRVLDLLDTSPQIVDPAEPKQLDEPRGAIELDSISFEYVPGVPIIRSLSLSIPAGATAAFVGSTGSGKSTLVKLLLRLCDVQAGAIRFDGIDIRELRLHDLRRAIGLVSQDVFLFHGSVRDNITYGAPDATLEEIIEVARIAEAHDFIERLPDGYDTIVGERGQKLSGGQRQRISIARALLKDPCVLVLDEATSSVDNETEAAIQRSLDYIAVGRTTLIIAHRLSTIRNADITFVLDDGKVVERGSHDELIAKDGIYAHLWRVQTGETRSAA